MIKNLITWYYVFNFTCFCENSTSETSFKNYAKHVKNFLLLYAQIAINSKCMLKIMLAIQVRVLEVLAATIPSLIVGSAMLVFVLV